jgi:putative redox protein
MAKVLSVEVEQVGPATSRVAVRSHTLMVDRPLDRGGEDRGPQGGELLLVSLGGCFVSTLLAAIRTREADISDVRVLISGAIGGVPERFETISMRIAAKYGDADLMRKLIVVAERGCLVTTTLKDAVAISIELEES